MLIREARVSDLGVLRALLDESAAYVYRHHDYTYLILFNYFTQCCYVAESNNEVVGFVAGFRSESKEDTYFLWQLVVAKDARRSGIGMRLVERFAEAALMNKGRYLEFTTTSEISLNLFKTLAQRKNFAFATIGELSFSNRDTSEDESEILHRISFY